MPLKRFIILLSALLALSPLMSQLAMASASHSMQRADVMAKVAVVVNECSCSDQISDQTCPDAVCQCDTSLLALVFPVALSQVHAPQGSNNCSSLQNHLDRAQAVIVPPPIPDL